MNFNKNKMENNGLGAGNATAPSFPVCVCV